MTKAFLRDISEKPKTEKTAAALGLFDGLHIGHRAVIERAACQSGLSAAVFTFADGAVLPKLDGKQAMLLPEGEKRALLCDMGVKYICAPDFESVRDLSPSEFVREFVVERLYAAYVVCGYDFRFGKGGAGDADELIRLCGEYGVKCEVVPAVTVDGKAVSSADIRKAAMSGDVETANRLLGRELSYTLPVIEGKRIGRTIGFPTANQVIPAGLIRPMNGVYASRAVTGGREYPAMTDIGVKPTVTDSGEVIMETHIIGFDGDIYGEELTVKLLRFIRHEKKFSGLDELTEQLQRDVKICGS